MKISLLININNKVPIVYKIISVLKGMALSNQEKAKFAF
jgi:hypothetical protein